MKYNIFSSIRIVSLILGFVCMLLFYGFSRYIKNGGFKKIDFDVTVKIQEKIDKSARLRLANAVGNILDGSTFFAGPAMSIVTLGVLTLALLYEWRQKKFRWSAFFIPVLFGLLILAELYGKSVVHHPAPPFFMIKNPTTIFPKYYINESFSYPSGHAARAVFLSSILYFFIIMQNIVHKKGLLLLVTTMLIIGCVSTVCVALIYLGHHWFSDIIGGLLLGIGLACFGYSLLNGKMLPVK